MSGFSLNNLIKPKFLHRSHIRKCLDGIFSVPLFLAIAGRGFGKTTALRDFLRKKRKVKYIWFSFDEEETEDIWLWVKFCNTLRYTNSALSRKMFESGIPRSKADVDRLVTMISDAIEMETVIVFDDVYHCKSKCLHSIIENVAMAKIPQLHIAIISRTYPLMDTEKMLADGNAKIMKEKDFKFSKLESENFFILNDIVLSEDEVDKLYEKTKGWTAGLYLAFMYYSTHHDFDSTEIGNDLIRSTIYDRFDENIQKSLVILSKLPNFTLEQAEFVTENRGIREIIKKMYECRCFVKFDDRFQIYSFHSLLRDIMREEFDRPDCDIDKRRVYERHGDWCRAFGDRIDAIKAYTRCRDNDRILEIMSERYASNLMNSAPSIIENAFDQMELGEKLVNPIGYLTYIYSYSLTISIKKGAKMLEEAKEYYLKAGELEDKNQILGEIALIESLTAFNDLKKMFECYERANKYFDGGTSRIFDANVIITFGFPLTTTLYHKIPGDMIELVELVENEFWIFEHIANGCGAGYDYLIRAEYEYMRGNFETAEMITYKALYKAKTREQSGIIMSCLFILVRIVIFSGNFRELDDILIQMVQEVEKQSNPILLGCYEFVLGFVYSYTGQIEMIPQWLREGDMSKTKLMAPVRTVGYLLGGRITIELGNYEKLEEVSDAMFQMYKKSGNLTGMIVSLMYNAISKYHIEGKKQAKEVMIQALELAEPDDIYIVVAEMVYDAEEVLEDIGTPFALKILEKAKEYTANRNLYREGQRHIPLTKRECEIMDLVCEGYTAGAIGKILFVSQSTVKKHIAASYEKLGVNKKADAIMAYKKANKKTRSNLFGPYTY